ncbi:hypothetical protein CEXT_598301, partial [Caerostris extrusa]
AAVGAEIRNHNSSCIKNSVDVSTLTVPRTDTGKLEMMSICDSLLNVQQSVLLTIAGAAIRNHINSCIKNSVDESTLTIPEDRHRKAGNDVDLRFSIKRQTVCLSLIDSYSVVSLQSTWIIKRKSVVGLLLNHFCAIVRRLLSGSLYNYNSPQLHC